MRVRVLIIASSLVLVLLACTKDVGPPTETAQAGSLVSPKEAKAIAQEAYIYAYPMLENYRTMYAQALDKQAPGFTAPFNEFSHRSELLGPDFKDIVRPNNDTLYSLAWLNLRAQPIVITVPQIEDRYYSIQLVDMYTNNLGYIGTRTTGSKAGSYLVAGPRWQGAKPGDVKRVFRSQSNFVYCIIRTGVDGQDDVPAVVKIQQGYHLTPLNVFLGRSRVPVASGLTFSAYDPQKAKSAGFIDYLNFLLTQVRVPPSEKALMKRFALIGIVPGQLSASMQAVPVMRDAIDEGVGIALVEISKTARDLSEVEGVNSRAHGGWQGTTGLFGSPEAMRGRYLARAVAAMIGLYGNDEEEAYYPIANYDASGDSFDGAHQYVMRFEKSELPRVDGFWSMTMYSLPDQLMVANPINRYSIGDRSELRYGKDGSLTLYIQNESPGMQKASNWLPAPDHSFSLQFRMYLPKPEALDSPLYLPPPVERVR
ncbi:MAG: DUF1254 domain-containing protein [Myxococcales bacterium]|nr:DUF1254 domain-containing protein [Myxococcales bacterium]MDH3845989.1 DUF1254 domain-containing protein [Myxococcales bacterium]